MPYKRIVEIFPFFQTNLSAFPGTCLFVKYTDQYVYFVNQRGTFLDQDAASYVYPIHRDV